MMSKESGLQKAGKYQSDNLQHISVNQDFVKRQYYQRSREPEFLSLLESGPRAGGALISGYMAKCTTGPQYKDTEDTDPDNLLHCPECDAKWGGKCPLHGNLHFVTDVPVPRHAGNTLRADLTAPYVVNIRTSPTGHMGVTARMPIPIRTRFGPYEGQIVPLEEASEHAWLIRRDGKPDHCIDAREPGLSNWMRYIQSSPRKGDENLLAYQHLGELYYMTLRNIYPGEELLVWCGSTYNQPYDEVVQDFQENARGIKMEVLDDTVKNDRGSSGIGNPVEQYSTDSATTYIKKEIEDPNDMQDGPEGGISEESNAFDIVKMVKKEAEEDSYCESVCRKEDSQSRTSDVSENVILDIEDVCKKIKLEVSEDCEVPFIKEEVEMEEGGESDLRDEVSGSAAEVSDEEHKSSDWQDRADYMETDSGNGTVASEESDFTNGYNAGSTLPTAVPAAVAEFDDPYRDKTESAVDQALAQLHPEAEPKKILSCSDCQKFFGSSFALDRHVHMHHRRKSQETGTAVENPIGEKIESLADTGLTQSRSEAKPKSRILTCHDCKRFFEGSIALDRHRQMHHRSKPLGTGNSIGEKTESSADKSSAQSRSEAKPKSRIVSCCDCKRFFEGNIALERHKQMHHRGKLLRTASTVEDPIGEKNEYFGNKSSSQMRLEMQPNTRILKSFEGNVALDRHIQMCHPSKLLETATVTEDPTGEKNESSVDKVSSQIRLESQPEENALSCSDCSKSFACNFALGRHLKKHHESKPFYCGACKVAFACKSDLTQHRHKDKRFGCHERSNQFLFEGKFRNFTSHGKAAPFFCSQRDDCFLRFTTRRGYQKHVLKHKMQMTVKCPKCLKELGSEANLNVHLKRTVCSYLPYICPNCRIAFKDNTTLKDHSCVTSTQGNESVTSLGASENQLIKRPYLCSECKSQYDSRHELHEHFRVSHKPQTSIFCVYCKKMYSTYNVLRKHVRRVHSKERPHVCRICNKEFFAGADLQRHLLTHSGEQTYTCIVCVRYFHSKGGFAKHLLGHKNELNCRVCFRQYKSYIALQHHMGQKHHRAMLFECPQCKEKLSYSNLEEHFEYHVSEKLLAHQAADVPPVNTESNETLTLFENASSELTKKRKGIHCTDCERAFSDEQALYNHVCNPLSQEERLECKKCSKEFNTRLDFDRHYSCHQEERPYLCVECNSDFSCQSLLDQHQCIDNKERPYACSECDRRFWSDFAYKTHLRSHVADKPHVCSECAESFSHPEQLEAHIYTHGKDTTFICFECDPVQNEKYRLNRSFPTQCDDGGANLTCIQCNRTFSYDSLSEQASQDHRPFEFVSCEPD